MESEPTPTLTERLKAEMERANPSLARAEEMIVKGLNQYGFGEQTQVTAHDSFEIAVDDLIITVELNKEDDVDDAHVGTD